MQISSKEKKVFVIAISVKKNKKLISKENDLKQLFDIH